MRISDRLYSIYESVLPGESIADIGTDHGYVPLMLYRDGISPKVIMSDISEASVSKARESFKSIDLPVPEDWFRVGDGLDTLNTLEVDTVIIAGLGGKTIIDIMACDIEKTRSFKKFILQPRKCSGKLRAFLYENGFDIIREALSQEGKFVCETMTAVTGKDSKRELPYSADDIRWKYPESFARCDSELLKKRLDWKFSSIDEELSNLSNSKSDQSKLIEKLNNDKLYLMNLMRVNQTIAL